MTLIVGIVAAGARDVSRLVAYEAGHAATVLPRAEPAGTRDPLRARIDSLSGSQVKQFYLRCSNAALLGRLDGNEAAVCSIGYDVLLERHFGGDFHALLAWSRAHSR